MRATTTQAKEGGPKQLRPQRAERLRGVRPRAESLEERSLLSMFPFTSTGNYNLIEFQNVPFGTDASHAADDERLASFTGGGPQRQPSDFTVTIDWGDQSPTSAGVVVNANAVAFPVTGPVSWLSAIPNSFYVNGGHTYTQAGTFTITVTIQDTSGDTLVVQDQASVAPGPLASTGPTFPVTMVVGQTSTAELGQLFDERGPQNLSAYQVTIDWGDGTTSSGSLNPEAYLPWQDPHYPADGIQGDHTYSKTGFYTITATVTDQNGDSTTETTQASAALEQVIGPSSLYGVGSNRTLDNVTLAYFADPGSGSNPSDFTATIDWGDGTTSTGTVSLGTNSGGTGTPADMIVTGSHTYAQDVKPGTIDAIRITITEGNTVVAVGLDHVVIDPDPVSQPQPIYVPPPQGSTLSPVNPGGPMMGLQPPGQVPSSVDSLGNGQGGPIAPNVPQGPTTFTNGAESLFSAQFQHAKSATPHHHHGASHPKLHVHHFAASGHHRA